MIEYPSNSQQPKTPEVPTNGQPVAETKKVEKIVSGVVVARKKPLGQKFKETFFGGDGKSVAQFVMMQVLLPAAKDMISKAVSEGVDRMIYGESQSRSRSSSRPSGNAGYIQYNRPATGGNPPWRTDPREEPRRQISPQARSNHDFNGLLFDKRVEADEVHERMYDLLSQYGQVTVSDLYNLVGMTDNPVDLRWGWTDLEGSRVARARNGYFLDLPPTTKLD